MLGHTGNIKATIQGIETVDMAIGSIVQSSPLARQDPVLIITADHGNAEQMKNPQTGEIDKEHTTNPVPFILVDSKRKKPVGKTDKALWLELASQQPTGILADIAPTIVEILGLSSPSQFTGKSLLRLL